MIDAKVEVDVDELRDFMEEVEFLCGFIDSDKWARLLYKRYDHQILYDEIYDTVDIVREYMGNLTYSCSCAELSAQVEQTTTRHIESMEQS